MAIQATTEWRIRHDSTAGGTEGEEAGGGFDSSISGAGTDYTDQAAPQLSLADLATPGAGSTTLTSAVGGFTSAMIGNCIRIKSGTNFDNGYYFITARTDTNTVTLDRSASASGAGSSGAGDLGGAFKSFVNLGGTGNGGLASPTITSPLAAGHTVWIYGSGNDDPSSNDYDWGGTGTGYWQSSPNGDTTNGRILIKGYNGRPRIQYSGLIWFASLQYHIEHFKFFRNTNGSFVAYGLFDDGNSSNNNTVSDLRFDMNGQDAVALICHAGIDIYVGNSGAGAAGSQTAIQGDNYAALFNGCTVEDVRGDGFGASWGSAMMMFVDCIAINCGRHGFYTLSTTRAYRVNWLNCTAYSCGSDGFHCTTAAVAANTVIRNCLSISNGGYGYNIATGSVALGDRLVRGLWGYNASYNNTSGARQYHSAQPNDVTLVGNPFINAAGGDFSLNLEFGRGDSCREDGFPGVFRGISTTGYRDIGAAETQDAGGGGGGGGSINRGIMTGGRL